MRRIQTRALSTHQIILEIGRAIRATSGTQEALDVMCAALGEGLRVDRVLANTVGIQHGVQVNAQWHRPGVRRLRYLTVLPELGGLAEELWLAAGFRAEDDLLAVEQPPPELVRPFIQEAGARAVVMVPIGLGDRVIGIIYVIMVLEPRAWTAAETDVVQAAATSLPGPSWRPNTRRTSATTSTESKSPTARSPTSWRR